MKKYLIIFVFIVLLIILILKYKNKPTMEITSPVFQNNNFISEKYTCDGQNINPPLIIDNTPINTKSLVLIVDDPDAPSGIWTHWTIWNISPTISEISENSLPTGAVEGITSWGKSGYSGPCPHSGTHRYFFKLFALDTILDLSSSSNVDQLLAAIQNHILTKTEIIVKYSKK
jgi:Raf kinase inhibitor-like YbhB/YbcL family protein